MCEGIYYCLYADNGNDRHLLITSDTSNSTSSSIGSGSGITTKKDRLCSNISYFVTGIHLNSSKCSVDISSYFII